MIVIITMAGLGSRFRKAGYNCPKYMIEAKGKTLFDWSMDSLVGYNKKYQNIFLSSARKMTVKSLSANICQPTASQTLK